MEYSTHVFLQSTPTTEQNFESKFVEYSHLNHSWICFFSRLQDISDQITTNGCISPNVFAPLTNLAVRQAIVSSRHLAFLLQDGRICRVSFRIQTDKIDPNTIESNTAKSRYLPRSHSRPSLQRVNLDNPGLPPQINASGQLDFFSSYSLSRQRSHMVRPTRGRAGIFLGSRPMVPASSVPEDLIEQVRNEMKDSNRNDRYLGSSGSARKISKSDCTRITTHGK